MRTRRRLNRALLARQGLLAPLALGPVAAVERLFGLQSQNPEPPYYALWARCAGFDPQGLAAALDRRTVVRIALHRSTIHLVTGVDAARLRPLVEPGIVRATNAAYGALLQGVDRVELAALARQAMATEPLSIGGLGRALATRWPDRDVTALGNAARAHLPLVQVPPRGVWGRTGLPVHVPLDTWRPDLAGAEPMGAAEALTRYLAAFGPASLADAQKCLGVTGLRSAASALGERLVPVTGEDGAALVDLAEATGDPSASPPGEVEVGVRLLAPFDAAVLSHVDRRRILGDLPISSVVTVNGQVRGTVLLDGFVAATWLPVRRGERTDVEVRPLRRCSGTEQAEVQAEARRLLDDLHPGRQGTVRISPG